MRPFWALCVNEWQKWNKRRRLLILAAVMALFPAALLAIVLGFWSPAPPRWQALVQAQIAANQAELSKLEQQLPRLPKGMQPGVAKMITAIQGTNDQLQYQLAHNIAPSDWYAAAQATQQLTGSILRLLVLLVAWLGAESIAQERADGTIRLWLSHPASRSALLASKFVSLTAAIAAALLLGWLLCFGTAGLLQGHWGGFDSRVLLWQDLSKATSGATSGLLLPLRQYCLEAMALAFLVCLMAAGGGMLASVLTQGPGAAIGLSLGLLVGGQLLWGVLRVLYLNDLLYLPFWAHFLFIAHLSPVGELGLSSRDTVPPPPPGSLQGYDFAWVPTVSLAGWSAVFVALATLLFTRRDELG
ncbi:MAG: ABC transporter permease subunit [Firmicutes bacterium]|nr:ABC transporter permease subunit [Bacillota bacterium]